MTDRDDLDGWLDAAAGPDEEAVRRIFRLALRRAPDEPARERALAKLQDGTMSRASLLRELVQSEEFERVVAYDDAVAYALALRRAPRDVRGPARPRDLRAPAWSNERLIEVPWCVARYDGEQRVLDVGYSFADAAHLAALDALAVPELVGVDLTNWAAPPSMRAVHGDLRELPFDDGAFDLVFCVSTLEHIGMDNSFYMVEDERDDEGIDRALRELRRVLARDGRMLLTVPAGEPQDLGSQLQLEPDEWVRRFEDAGFLVFEDELYRRDDDGWRSATDARGVRYDEEHRRAGAVLCLELRPARLTTRLRLAARDARHRGERRRSTR